VRLLVLGQIIAAFQIAAAQTTPSGAAPSVVYVAHNPAAIKGYKTDPPIVRSMVNRLVTAVTNQPNVVAAWKSLVSPKEKIGIKISATGGEIFTTHRDIVNAIVDGLAAAGHRPESIVVWDRSLEGAAAAGYKAETYRLASVAPRDGYDAKAVVSAPILGKLVWGDYEYVGGTALPLSDTENTSTISHFARVLTTDVTKVINVPVMSDSETNGIAGCIYNMTVPNVDNWRRFTQSTRFGGASLAEIYSDPMIEKKVILNIMDGLIAEYAGGPQAYPNFQLHHATIYASRDPVAIDAVALKEIEEWRQRAKVPALGPRAMHVEAAAQLGLGNAAPERIQIRTVSP
jgi:Uncharacterized conserved protein